MDNLNFRGQAGISSAQQQREAAELGIEMARKSAASTLGGIAQVARLREQRDELLAALKALRQATAEYCDAGPIGEEYTSSELDRVNCNADALIAKIEGKGDE